MLDYVFDMFVQGRIDAAFTKADENQADARASVVEMPVAMASASSGGKGLGSTFTVIRYHWR